MIRDEDQLVSSASNDLDSFGDFELPDILVNFHLEELSIVNCLV